MLQYISHYNQKYDYLQGIQLALDGGCKWIQLRVKHTIPHLEELALQVKELCKQYDATFIIDDNVELVKKVGADGVHLGLNDMPIKEAREILGDSFIIGGTANSAEHIIAHYKNGANYIGLGPFRFTETKQNLSPILGLEGYSAIVAILREQNINIPIVGIGGIKIDDIDVILKTGINGIAMSGTILNAENPSETCKTIVDIINNHINE